MLCRSETSQVAESSGRRVTPRATHALVREGQLPEKDTFVTVRGSLIAGVLAFGG